MSRSLRITLEGAMHCVSVPKNHDNLRLAEHVAGFRSRVISDDSWRTAIGDCTKCMRQQVIQETTQSNSLHVPSSS